MFPRFLTICLIFCETLIFDLDIGSHNVALVLSREVFLCCWFLASMKNGICVFGSWQHSRRVFLSFLSYHSRRMYRCFTISQQKNVSLLNDSTAERCIVGSWHHSRRCVVGSWHHSRRCVVGFGQYSRKGYFRRWFIAAVLKGVSLSWRSLSLNHSLESRN